jgi:hypothetical protein
VNARATRGPQRGAGRRPTHNRPAGSRKISVPPNLGPPSGPPTPNSGCRFLVILIGGVSVAALVSAVVGAAYAGGWLS